MRFHSVVLFVAAQICSALAEPGSRAARERSSIKPKCRRMFPWMAGHRVAKCTYPCMGWPFRYENEPDGLSCRAPFDGICMNGKCVPADLYRSTSPAPPTTDTERRPYTNDPTSSSAISNRDFFPVREANAPAITLSDGRPYPEPEVRSTTHSSRTASRQKTRPQVLTTPRSDLYSAAPSFQTTHTAQPTLKQPIYLAQSSNGITIVNEGTASSISNKATQPSSSPRIYDIRATTNQQTASEDAFPSTSFNHSTQQASTPVRYEGKHTENIDRAEGSSRGRLSTLSRHQTTSPMPAITASRTAHVTKKSTQEEGGSTRPVTTPTVLASKASSIFGMTKKSTKQLTGSTLRTNFSTTTPMPANKASSTTHGDGLASMARDETLSITSVGNQPSTSISTSAPTTRDLELISKWHDSTSASPYRDPSATEVSHKPVPTYDSTVYGTDFSSKVWSSTDESTTTAAAADITPSGTMNAVSHMAVGATQGAKNSSIPPSTTAGTVPSAHSVGTRQIRDPSSFELSIEINVRGRLPFLKH